jgi:hypothetical protein
VLAARELFCGKRTETASAAKITAAAASARIIPLRFSFCADNNSHPDLAQPVDFRHRSSASQRSVGEARFW